MTQNFTSYSARPRSEATNLTALPGTCSVIFRDFTCPAIRVSVNGAHIIGSAKLNDWVQGVGIFALVASLIFVGIEVRQNSIATRSATNAAVKDSFRESNLVLASSPELARATSANAENPADSPPEAKIQMLALWRALFHTWSNVHRQHLNRTLDPALFDAVVQEVSMNAVKTLGTEIVDDAERRGRHMRWALESERVIFNQDFQIFVDGILSIER